MALMPEGRRVALCRADAIAEGTARGFDLAGEGEDTIFLVRVAGRLTGWRNACPHVDGAPMAWRKDHYLNAAGTRVVCHGHGAEFLPDSGLCVQGPCVGRRLTPAPIEIDIGGTVYTVND
jgi:nitrite reductase/ring-hydroxylating ferredoxin subunit